MRYEIADIILEFSGDFPQNDRPPWSHFRYSGPLPPDYRFRGRYTHTLPELPGGHSFYDSVRGRTYALTHETEAGLELFVLSDARPWGLEVHHLYEELALPHVLLHKGKLLLHASYIETPRGAIVFTAPSGTGKSTQAELWRRHRGATVINGDRAVLGLREGRLTVYGYPMSGSSDDCINRTLPLRCLVSLAQGPENEIQPLKGRDALRVLLNGTYRDPKHPGDMARNMEIALQLLAAPIFHLTCRPDVGAVEALEQALNELEQPSKES